MQVNEMSISTSKENYLKIIWRLEQERLKVTSKTVADELSLKPPTVLAMYRQLQKEKLIAYNRADGARLTDLGENKARKLVRKHRLIEAFLETVLEMDSQHVHDEAETLEHAISDQLMYRIDAYLGFPTRDPHGSSIPNWEEDNRRIFLSEVADGASFTIKELNMASEELSYYLEKGFQIGSSWTMAGIPPGAACFLVGDGRHFLAIPRAVAIKTKIKTWS